MNKKISSIFDKILKFDKLLIIFVGAIITFIVCNFMIFNKISIIPTDIKFHINRFQSLGNIWKSPVNFNAFNRQGKAIAIFYPWYLIYPYHILFKFTHNYVLSYKIYYVCVIFISTQISYYCSLSMLKNKKLALALTFAYILSPTTVGYLYSLAANGQIIAIGITPIMILGIYNLFFGDYRKWYWFVVGFALFSISHLISIFIYFIICLVALVISWKRNLLSFTRFKYMLLPGLFVTLYTLCAFAPIFEQRHVYDLVLPPNLDIGNRTSSLFAYLDATLSNKGLAAFGLLSLLGIIVGFIKLKSLNKMNQIIIILVSVMVLFMSNIFPWGFVEDTILGQIQDTHRFMLPVIYITLIMLVTVFNENYNLKENTILTFVVISSIILFFSFFASYYALHKTELKTKHMSTTVRLKKYYSPDYENNNVIDKKSLKIDKFHAIYVAKRDFNYYLNKKKVTKLVSFDDNFVKIKINSQKPGILHTSLNIYKGIQITNNNKFVLPILNVKRGMLDININKGINNIYIKYKYTLIYQLTRILFIITTILFGIVVWISRRQLKR